MSRSEVKTKIEKPAWEVGDVVVIGRERWAVRIVRGEHVELEALNVSPGIWWTTTQALLPDKVVAA